MDSSHNLGIPSRVTSLPFLHIKPVSNYSHQRPPSQNTSIELDYLDGLVVSDADLALGSPGPVFHNHNGQYSPRTSSRMTPTSSPWNNTASQDWSLASVVSKRDTPIMCEGRDAHVVDTFAAYSEPNTPRTPLAPFHIPSDYAFLNARMPIPSILGAARVADTEDLLEHPNSFEDLHRDLISMSRDERLYSLIAPANERPEQIFQYAVEKAFQETQPSSSLPRSPVPTSTPCPFDFSAMSNRIPFSGIDTWHNSIFEDKVLMTNRQTSVPPVPAIPRTPTTPRTPISCTTRLPLSPQISPKTTVFSSRPMTASPMSRRMGASVAKSSFYDIAPVTSPRPEQGQWSRNGSSIGPASKFGPAPSCQFTTPTQPFGFEELAKCRHCGFEAGFHRERCPVGDQAPFVSVFEDDDEKAGVMEYIRNKCRARKVSGSASRSGSTAEKTSSTWTSSGTSSPNKRSSMATSYSPRQSVADQTSKPPGTKSRSQSKKWLHRLSCAVRGD